MAVVFNIQRFSVHDGPGIRTTVFLKGCNLACAWCHNPESIRPQPQMQYFAEKCSGCNMCAAACTNGLCVANGVRSVTGGCIACGGCAENCMQDALKLAGREMSPRQVMDVVAKDKAYYQNSGGGLTLSGGEPLLQPDFCAGLLALARQEGIHTAVDTAGNVPWSAFQKVLPHTDAVLLDLKCMDDGLHRQYTGASNARILENARRLFEEAVDLYIRIPVIVGVNDTEENMRAAAAFMQDARNIVEIRLLPYHSMGQDKAQSVGRGQQTFTAPAEERLRVLAAAFDRPVAY